MADHFLAGAIITASPEFKPGDMPPKGYLDWHEWAEVQHKAGLRQVSCAICGKWRYPQELSNKTVDWTGVDNRGRKHEQTDAVCKACDRQAAEKEEA